MYLFIIFLSKHNCNESYISLQRDNGVVTESDSCQVDLDHSQVSLTNLNEIGDNEELTEIPIALDIKENVVVSDNKNNYENCNEGDVIKEIAERNNNIENEAKLLTCDQSTSNARETVKEVKEIVNNGEESSTVKNEEIKDESNATVKEEDALPGSAQAVKTVKSTNKVTNDEAEGCKKIKVNDANDKTSNYEKPKIKTYFLKNDVTVTIAQNDKSETSVKEKCTESKSSKQEKSPSNVSLQQLLPKKFK